MAAALNSATAVGQGAKALGQVSVAIGNRAMVSGLHTNSGVTIDVPLTQRTIIVQKRGSETI